MKVGYVRVSTIEQHEDRQIKALEELGCEKIFTDKCSGKNTDRPAFNDMMSFVRDGDTLYVSEFSRLARSTRDLLNIIDELKVKNVHVISQKENFDTDSPQGKYKGRLKKKRPVNYDYYKDLYYRRELSATAFAKKCHVSRPTLYGWLKEDKEQLKEDAL